MTSVSRLDTSTPRALTQAELEHDPEKLQTFRTRSCSKINEMRARWILCNRIVLAGPIPIAVNPNQTGIIRLRLIREDPAGHSSTVQRGVFQRSVPFCNAV